jgi:hypothetical protein
LRLAEIFNTLDIIGYGARSESTESVATITGRVLDSKNDISDGIIVKLFESSGELQCLRTNSAGAFKGDVALIV